MKALALVVWSTVAFGQSAEVRPEPATAGRGWATGLGIGLVGAGIVSLALGGVFTANAVEADSLIKAYNGAPTRAQAVGANELDQRSRAAWGAAVPLFMTGGVLVAGGVACALLERLFGAAPKVTFIGLKSGGLLAVLGSF
jgi:ABC-type transport system involved in cytochrome c biogenesis permease subunit